MHGYIYKITCLDNKKIYIGQTSHTIQQRLKRHFYDAIDNPKQLNTKFARAIRKHGKEAFIIEELESVDGTTDDLTIRESYYVNLYNSVVEGYNSFDPLIRSGGNTYAGKSDSEIAQIKLKISKTKYGELNPMAKAIKCLDTSTNEILHFGSVSDAMRYLNQTNHQFITKRCLGVINSLFKQRYLFAYEENNFPTTYTRRKNNSRRRQITVISHKTNEQFNFESFTEADLVLGFGRGMTQKIVASGNLVYKDYKFIIE